MSSSSLSMWTVFRRRGRRGRGSGRLDRGRRHPVLGHHRGSGDGLQRLVKGEAVPWASESYRAGAEVHRHPQRPGHPDPRGRDRGGRHRSDQIRYETSHTRKISLSSLRTNSQHGFSILLLSFSIYLMFMLFLN